MSLIDILYKRFGMDGLKAFSSLTLLLPVLLGSCDKNELNPGNPAAIQVFNALNDGTVLYTNLSEQRPTYFRLSQRIFNKNYVKLNEHFVDASPFTLSLYSSPDTMPKDVPILTVQPEFESGAVYSMFIYGSKSSAKYTWQKDRMPMTVGTDSVTWIRFANFSEDQDISVNLKGQPPGSFAQSLPLHAVSDFVKLSVDMAVEKYEFDITDQHTGELISTYVIDKIYDPGTIPWYHRSNTLVLTGKQGSTGTLLPAVTRINHR